MKRAKGAAALHLVGDDAGQPAAQQPALEEVARDSVQRRQWLKLELSREEARLVCIRRQLANQRGVAFIRVEALEREFGQ